MATKVKDGVVEVETMTLEDALAAIDLAKEALQADAGSLTEEEQAKLVKVIGRQAERLTRSAREVALESRWQSLMEIKGAANDEIGKAVSNFVGEFAASIRNTLKFNGKGKPTLPGIRKVMAARLNDLHGAAEVIATSHFDKVIDAEALRHNKDGSFTIRKAKLV